MSRQLYLPLEDGGLAMPDNVVQPEVVVGVHMRDEDHPEAPEHPRQFIGPERHEQLLDGT